MAAAGNGQARATLSNRNKYFTENQLQLFHKTSSTLHQEQSIDSIFMHSRKAFIPHHSSIPALLHLILGTSAIERQFPGESSNPPSQETKNSKCVTPFPSNWLPY